RYALPLLFVCAILLVAITGCTSNTTTQNQSGGGTGTANVAVKINSVANKTQIGSGYLVSTPKAGSKYMVFDVTVTNLNEKSQDIGNPYYFKLSTKDGTAYEITSSSFLGDSQLKSVSNTNPGEKTSGTLAFEVPQSAIATKLTYNDYTNQVVTNL
ncbi:MAG: DUF4352 domain-containing protein, partial [Halobacteriota archaeon]